MERAELCPTLPIMDEEEVSPVKSAAPKNLAPLSVSELRAYIFDLQEEIRRVEGEIERKQAHLKNAASLFKKPTD